MNIDKLNFLLVAGVILSMAVAGCSQRPAWTPPRDDSVVFAPDPANPSNLFVTITFLNPEETSEKPIVINYHSVFLQRRSATIETNVFFKLSPGPTQGMSLCTFSIPRNEVTNCRVYLAGVDSKPVGEAEVAREIQLEDPNNQMQNIGTHAPYSDL